MENFKIDYAACKTSPDGNIMAKIEKFQSHFKEHEKRGLNIYARSPMISACDREVEILDRHTGQVNKMLMFGSNSYLNATICPAAVKKASEVIKQCGIGTGGVPLLSGTSDYQNQLEKEIAQLLGFDDTILFSSGFTANIGALVGLVGPNNLLVFDKLNHASLIDGALMSGAKMTRYLHSNMHSLEKILSQNADQYPCGMMVVTDGVFSMDGDVANLPELLRLTKKYNTLLLIDDAHATGIIGEGGAGTLSYFGITERDNIIVTGTLSKAIGTVGGFITASQKIIDYLRVYARSNMYSTALPQSVCAAAYEVLQDFKKHPEQREALNRNHNYVRSRLNEMGFNTLHSITPIIPVIIGDEYVLTNLIKDIYDQGIFVNAIFPPVVPPKMCRIRIGVMSCHTLEDCDRMLDVFYETGKKYGII